MKLDQTCTREIYLGLFLTPESPNVPIAKYKICGSLIDGRQIFCEQCLADSCNRYHDAGTTELSTFTEGV